MKKKLMALLLVLLLSLALTACGGDKQDNADNKGNADNKDVLADWQQLPAQFMLTFDAADGFRIFE
ncbi:MAG: hypothetical protein IKC76_05210 [Firmicutes bacterium]|nr:hypothetical protein [Bacillota bacterium]MBQ6841858.1 hypothetical protein [Bacillota bacterium]MBR7113897.1 hypothetical protein [Bacillota bacterium]